MARINYIDDAARIAHGISAFEQRHGALLGIVVPEARAAFIDQIIDSEQRVKYFDRLQQRDLDPASTDPASDAFDPLRAAIIHRDAGEYDEAVWLVYLFVHFGKHRSAGWRYIRDIYGRLGEPGRWDWSATAGDPTAFRFWLDDHQESLKAANGPRGFGNHRKYESLDAWSAVGTGSAVESYISWVLAAGGDHTERFSEVDGLEAGEAFDQLYRSLNAVVRFGRVARFDYLMTLSKLRLLDLRPPHTYLVGATGPLRGAQLLVNADSTGSARDLQQRLALLGTIAGLRPDVLEDAVCNWQKSPNSYVRFSG